MPKKEQSVKINVTHADITRVHTALQKMVHTQTTGRTLLLDKLAHKVFGAMVKMRHL